MIHYLDGAGNDDIETIATNGGTIDTIAIDMLFIQEVQIGL